MACALYPILPYETQWYWPNSARKRATESALRNLKIGIGQDWQNCYTQGLYLLMPLTRQQKSLTSRGGSEGCI